LLAAHARKKTVFAVLKIVLFTAEQETTIITQTVFVHGEFSYLRTI